MSNDLGTPSIIAGISSPLKTSYIQEAKQKLKHTFARKVSDSPSASYFQKIVAEFVGTYIFIFVGCASNVINGITPISAVGVGVVWGFTLMALIYTVGHVSGAHFNPAVTIALASSGRLPLLHVPVYIIFQVSGATLASLTLRVLFHEQHNIYPAVTQYKSPTTDLEAVVWEFIATFILMFVICSVATDNRANKQLSGVAIGSTLLVDVTITGPITGASMNPARSIGPALASGVYKNLWVYVVAPILGALAAVLVYSVLRVPEPDIEDKPRYSYNNVFLGPEP